MSKLNYFRWLFVCLAWFCLPITANAQQSLILGIHPYKTATELTKKFSPLAGYLSRKLGQPVIIRIGRNYQEHIKTIGENKVDIAYMGPASYVTLVKVYGRKPLLARLEIKGKPFFQGHIVIAKDSPIQRLGELIDKRFAFGDPNSTMSHLVPRFMLWKVGVDVKKLSKFSFMGNHKNVALGVLTGNYDAGAVKEAVFYEFQKRGLKSLQTTPSISEHLFVARSTLPPELVNKLRDALFHLKDSPEGKAVMHSIKKSMTGMVAVNDADYGNLRSILKKLKELGVQY